MKKNLKLNMSVSIKDIELIKNQNGINSQCFIITSTHGNKFVLKKHKNYSKAQISAIKDIVSHCRVWSAKVPEYITDDLMKFCPGTKFSGDNKELRSLAYELAVLHGAMRGMKYKYAPNKTFYKHLQLEEIRDFKKILGKDYLFMENVFKEHVAEAKNINFSKCYKQLCHYDLQPGNVLFKDKKVACILDFDAMRMDFRMRDIAFASFRFACRLPPGDVLVSITRFLSDYNLINPITDEEVRSYKWFLIDRLLDSPSYVLRKYKLGHTEWSASLPKFIGFLKIVSKIEEINITGIIPDIPEF